MSLVGSLEDLGLGDILQIVGLSRKSGVLYLRCDGGEGRIVLDQGMVRGAAVKGRFEDLRGLLLGGGHLEEEILDRAEAEAAASGAPLLQTLVRVSGQPLERLEALCRRAVEAAVMDMFEWRSG